MLLAFLISACGPDYVYDKTYEMEQQSWSYADTLEFSFEVADTNTIYNLWLELGHSTSYKNQNLYTQIHTVFPSGQRITETLSLEMANKAGQWLGDCSGDICELRIPIQSGAYFDQSGTHRIIIAQHMRRNPVEGIRSISFRLEDTGQSR